jgi:hypothetical protein
MEKQIIDSISQIVVDAYTNQDSQRCTDCGEICIAITLYCDNESYNETIKNLKK